MNHAPEKGTNVTHAERSPMLPRTATGPFAKLRVFSRARGTGAPSRRPLVGLTLAASAATLCLALLVPGTASASFTRPFLRQITGTPSGPFSQFGLKGVATDAAANLWVSDLAKGPPYKLDQFEYPTGAFLQTLEIEGFDHQRVNENGEMEHSFVQPERLAIDRSTGSFYATGEHTRCCHPFIEEFDSAGSFVKFFGSYDRVPHLAVDNSTEPSAGSLYVTQEAETFAGTFERKVGTVEKLNESGEPVDFSLAEEPGHPAYVSGNQITGTPSESFLAGDTPNSIAVDTHGNIYVVNFGSAGGEEHQVDEYAPSGLFIRAFTGSETPGNGESHGGGGWGGGIRSIAVDSTSPGHAHLLVSVVEVTGKGSEAVIDEFDVPSGRFLHQITEASPGRRLHRAGEMTADSHGDVYLVEPEANLLDAWGPGRFDPSVRLGEVTGRTPEGATLNGSVNPESLVNPEAAGLAECEFEYVTEAAFQATGFSDLSTGGSAECAPKAAEIPADEAFHPVSAQLTGLSPGATYRYRLSATTAGPLGGSASTGALAFTAPARPRIESAAAANVSSSFADLRATIDPLGAATTYQFQYLTQAQFEANGGSFTGEHAPSAVPAVPASIGSGEPTGSSPELVIQHIGGLQPSTAYEFRVLAENEIGLTEGLPAIFATAPRVVPGLPDGRAYELLTPPDKEGAKDMFRNAGITDGEFAGSSETGAGVASESGRRFLLTTPSAFGPFPGTSQSAYVFSRTAAGWSYASLADPALGVQAVSAVLSEPADFSQLGIEASAGSLASASGARNLNRVGPPGGPYATLRSGNPFHNGEQDTTATTLAGASHDLGHVVLESLDHALVPGGPAEAQDPGSTSLYEWSGGPECGAEGSTCALLNVNTKGELLSRCGALLGQSKDSGGARTAVSADGSRVIFTAPDPFAVNDGPGCWNGKTENPPQLYLRSAGATIEISKPQKGVTDPSGRRLAVFAGASADGSRVFFLDETWLTADHPETHDPELYEYDAETAKLSRVSLGEPGLPAAKAGAGLNSVPALSADGSAVYFTATGQLTSTAPASPGKVNGEPAVNLYRYDTATGATTYIATIPPGNIRSDTGNWWQGPSRLYGEVALSSQSNWETTPDGRYLLFQSTAELTGQSTAHHLCRNPDLGGASNDHCGVLYRYRYEPETQAGGSLLCVSCAPTGAPSAFSAQFERSVPPQSRQATPPRAISADGSYVFFDTADSLVPQDTNGTLDVYEWHDGTISLISSGHDSAPSFFLDSSPAEVNGARTEGANVFFGTHARLLPQDTDDAGDLYDARIGGGFPRPPAREGLCEADACSTPVPAPNDPTPSSESFQGAGNLHQTAVKPRHHKHHKRRKRHGRAVNHNRRSRR